MLSDALLDRAQATINRMHEPNRIAAQAWLDYCLGRTEKRPPVTPALERLIARYYIVDPGYGYQYDEWGRDMARSGVGSRRVFEKEPEELRKIRATKMAHNAGDPHELFGEFGRASKWMRVPGGR